MVFSLPLIMGILKAGASAFSAAKSFAATAGVLLGEKDQDVLKAEMAKLRVENDEGHEDFQRALAEAAKKPG